MTINAEQIKWFRDSSPYIDAHRGRTFVVCLTQGALDSDNLNNIITDLALLNSLGARLVLVYGTDEDETAQREIINGRKITPSELLHSIAGALGRVTFDLTSKFSASRPDSPVRREITTSTGNVLRAKPLGVLDGIDHLQTGEVRRVDVGAIRHQLDGRAIVLVPAIGYSPSGEVFCLEAAAVASHVARALEADKLIYMIADDGLRDIDNMVINEIDLSRVEQSRLVDDIDSIALLSLCDQACHNNVSRSHIISYEKDGALLEELFTRDGCGTQIVGHSYEQVRAASINDVPGILRLIEPLEGKGILVKRSRELLESEIDQFLVIDRDGLLISCAALYPFDKAGEVACVVTHPDYRNGDRGDRLLDAIEARAKSEGLEHLFVLTTQSVHWFTERGFNECDLSALPQEKQEFYNYQRNSRALVRQID